MNITKSYLAKLALVINALPMILGLVFINFVVIKLLSNEKGGVIAATLLIINSFASGLNIILSKHVQSISMNSKLQFATILSTLLAIVCTLFVLSSNSHAIFIGLFLVNAIIQQAKLLILFDIPYKLNSEQILPIHQSTSLNLIIERSFRGLAPGIAFVIVQWDWNTVCYLYAVSNLVSIAGLYILKSILSTNLNTAPKKTEQGVNSNTVSSLVLSHIAVWNYIFQFSLNFFISPATLIFLYAIKQNTNFQEGIITPLALLYGGVLIVSIALYTNFAKQRFASIFHNPFSFLSSCIIALGALFIFIASVSNILFWIASFIIGCIYGIILLTNNNEVIKLLHKSPRFLHFIALAQFYSIISVVPSYFLVGYLIDQHADYSILLFFTGCGCILSAIILLIFENTKLRNAALSIAPSATT